MVARLLALAGCALVLVGCTGEPTLAGSPAPSASSTAVFSSPAPTRPDGGPWLIKHGWDIPSPEFVRDNVKGMEQLPFDGVIIQMPRLSAEVRRQLPIPYVVFKDELAPVASTTFTRLNHNFVIVYATPSGGYFDDWSVPIDNFRNLARAAREAGFSGIAFDNEEYFGRTADYPENCSGRGLDECREQVQLRGRQIMQAIIAEWPDARLLAFLGPWLSDPATADVLGQSMSYNDVSWANELTGPFIVGMVEASAGSDARVIDGGEIYTARSQEQFQAIREWQKVGIAQESALIPDYLRDDWSSAVSAAFGVYDREILGADMNSSLWTETLTNALEVADEYVWAYTERYDWWRAGSGEVPDEWVAATRSARQE